MRHDGQPDLLGNLKRDIERRNAGRAAGVASDPHLDADDQVAVRVDEAYALTGIDEPQIGGLSDHDARTECKDAGKRDIEERQDAERRGFDDMPPEAMKIARPRAAGIDKGRRAAVARDLAGVDPERGAAPIDMRVQIDKPRRDDQAAHNDAPRALAPQITPDGHNTTAPAGNS